MADEYDIVDALKAIEDELLSSMMRNMDRHRAEEDDMGLNWTMWQAEQLKALEKFKKENQKRFKKQFKGINEQIKVLIRQARANGNMEQEIAILQAIKDGFKGAKRVSRGAAAEFFRLNDRKLDALIKATTDDMEKAETAILRRANDQYRKAIYNAQVYANTGAGTYEKAVDMATKDMLASGLTCVQYANGAMHKLSEYADMAIRTASKRAYLQGEGEKRQEWGITTVIVNKRGNPCPKCLPFCGKVLIDDVWSGGSQKDGKYPLVSYAIECGLYHPRCKDSHTTYFPGISTADDTWTEKELKAIGLKNKQTAERQYAERQAEKYHRLAAYSLDPDNQRINREKELEWRKRAERYTMKSDFLDHRLDTPSKMVDLVEKYTADEYVIIDKQSKSAFEYDPEIDAIVINPDHPQYALYDYREVMIHELAHRIDQYEFGSPMHTRFSEAIQRTEEQVLGNLGRYTKMFDCESKWTYNKIISDIMGCITDNDIVGAAQHSSQYIGVPGYSELEIFANVFTAIYQGDDETVQFIKTETPEVYKAFLEIVGGTV